MSASPTLERQCQIMLAKTSMPCHVTVSAGLTRVHTQPAGPFGTLSFALFGSPVHLTIPRNPPEATYE